MRLGNQLSRIPHSHRSQIKAQIFDVLEKSTKTIQKQIIDIIFYISKREFHFVMNEIERHLDCDGVLELANMIFDRYRSELASDTLWREISFVVDLLAQPLTKKFHTFSMELTHESRIDSMILLIDIFRSLATQELPAQLEENLSTWMFGFRQLLHIDQQAVVSVTILN